jgi:hypothetical protein
MPRCVSVGMLKDAVGPYPDRKGEKYDPIRVSPLRIAMATTRSEFNDFVDDLIANRDKYVLMTDPEKIDEEVLGNERPPLEEFLNTRIRKKKKTQLDPENASTLANAKTVEATPQNKVKVKQYETREVEFS